jgi:hypothetical protein
MRRPSYINHWIFRVVPGFFDLVYLLQFVIWLRHARQRGVHLHVVALLVCRGLLLLFAAYKAAQRQFGWPSLRAAVGARMITPIPSRVGNKLLNPRLLVLWSLVPVICDEAWTAGRTRER